jgi:transposase
MDAPPPLSAEDLAATPPAVLAFLRWQAEQIALLTKRVAELEAKLNKSPANSSKPPSSTHPHDKPPPAKSKSKRTRGGQPGHPKHERPLIPAENCNLLVPIVPTECRRCGRDLLGVDPQPLRHQVWELPEIKPIVTEYQQHRLVCSCGTSTCGQLPPGVPTGQAGPKLIAFAALLMACFRQSKRRAAQFMSMILNQPASPAWMVLLQNRAAEAVKPAYDELAAKLAEHEALCIDESPTKEGPKKAWVWTFVAATFTFFACRTIWRKLSFGTQSATGSRFVERLLTVVETCRRQSRNPFVWLTDAVHAHLNQMPASSLMLGA